MSNRYGFMSRLISPHDRIGKTLIFEALVKFVLECLNRKKCEMFAAVTATAQERCFLMLTQVEIVGIEEGAAVRDQGLDELECKEAMLMTGKFS